MSKLPERENEKTERFLEHVERLTKTELRLIYTREYRSWSNGKSRAKGKGTWSEAFEDFRDFLRELGPSRPGETLDRKNNENEFYAPGVVRWASKRQQANNRSTTRLVNSGGRQVAASELAREHDINPNTWRQSHRRSQSSEEAFAGMIEDVEKGRGSDPRLFRPWPRHRGDDIFARWEKEWEKTGGLRRGNNRYEFMIKTAKRSISLASDDLDQLEEAEVPRNDPRFEKAFEELGKNRDLLARAQYEKPLWEIAVSKYEKRKTAKSREQEALRGNNYLRFSEDNE